MSAHKHTPGPWSIKGASLNECKVLIPASKSGWPDDMQPIGAYGADRLSEANARLIAAAPELLSAAQNALQNLKRNLASQASCGLPHMGDDEHEAIRLLEAAITKATTKE